MEFFTEQQHVTTETWQSSVGNQSQIVKNRCSDILNQQTKIKWEPLYSSHNSKYLGINVHARNVKAEPVDGSQGYLLDQSGDLTSMESEYSTQINDKKREINNSIKVFRQPLSIRNSSQPLVDRALQVQSKQLVVLKSALNTIIKAESLSDEDFLGTSDEENDREDDLNYPDKDIAGALKLKSMYVERVTDIFTDNMKDIKKDEMFDGVTRESKEEREIQIEDMKNQNDKSQQLDQSESTKLHKKADFECPDCSCPDCSKIFKSKYTLKQHSVTHVKQKKKNKTPLKCELCLKVYTRLDNYRLHLESHNGKTYKCEHCGATYTHERDLLKHCKKKHLSDHETYECSLCPKTFTTYGGFTKHMDAHKGIRHECKVCGKSFSTKGTLAYHVKLHQNETNNYFTCNICQKMYTCTSKTTLDLHMQVHLGTQQFICNVYDKLFSRKTDLQRHQYIHTGEKPYKCTECTKCFRHPGHLGKHMRLHAGEQTCKVCGKMYVRFSEYARHMATHTTDKQEIVEGAYKTNTAYTCKLCKEILSSEINLLNHLKRHEMNSDDPSRPECYVCEQCGQSFTTKSNRARHKRRKHMTDDALCTCDLCSKVFSTSQSLKQHTLLKHFGRKPYPCPICPKGFYKKKDIERHNVKMHAQKPE